MSEPVFKSLNEVLLYNHKKYEATHKELAQQYGELCEELGEELGSSPDAQIKEHIEKKDRYFDKKRALIDEEIKLLNDFLNRKVKGQINNTKAMIKALSNEWLELGRRKREWGWVL